METGPEERFAAAWRVFVHDLAELIADLRGCRRGMISGLFLASEICVRSGDAVEVGAYTNL